MQPIVKRIGHVNSYQKAGFYSLLSYSRTLEITTHRTNQPKTLKSAGTYTITLITNQIQLINVNRIVELPLWVDIIVIYFHFYLFDRWKLFRSNRCGGLMRTAQRNKSRTNFISESSTIVLP